MSGRKTSFTDSAEAWSARPRSQSEAELDITPMIDVTFLLLIFFMVTSTMQGNPDRDLPRAEHGLGIEKAGAMIFLVKASEAGGSIESVVQSEEGVVLTLEEVRARVDDAVRANRPTVIIKGDGQATTAAVLEVAQTVSSVEGAVFFLGVRDKRRN